MMFIMLPLMLYYSQYIFIKVANTTSFIGTKSILKKKYDHLYIREVCNCLYIWKMNKGIINVFNSLNMFVFKIHVCGNTWMDWCI
jgi:hypothetical protein